MEVGLFIFGFFSGGLIAILIGAICDEIIKERKRRDNKLREDIRKDIIDYYESTKND